MDQRLWHFNGRSCRADSFTGAVAASAFISHRLWFALPSESIGVAALHPLHHKALCPLGPFYDGIYSRQGEQLKMLAQI